MPASSRRRVPTDQHPLMHQWLSLFWDAPRVARAGEVMIYSNHNYELLGEIVRRLSGRGLEQLARERVFDPLGMTDSYYVVPASESHRVVQRAPRGTARRTRRARSSRGWVHASCRRRRTRGWVCSRRRST